MSASNIYALIDEFIIDLDNMPKCNDYRNSNKKKKNRKKKKKKTKNDDNKEIRTSTSHPLKINWLVSEYQFVSKLPTGGKLKYVQTDTVFDSNTKILIHFKIGMTICPGKVHSKTYFIWNRDLNIDLDLIKQENVDIIVSLLSQKDIIRLKIESLFDEIKKRGMESVWYDIADGTIPNDEKLWKQYASYIGDQLTKKNKTVLVHCMGGLCRTGAFVLTVLKYLKLINNDSIGQGVLWIGKSRKSAGGTVKQIKFVHSLQF